MKTLFTFLLVLFSLTAQAQYKNTIYLATQPGDLGLGVRYDRSVSENIGLYATITKGNYRLADKGYIKDHVRTSIGYTIFLPQKPTETTEARFTCGIVYHKYGIRKYDTESINVDRAFSPVSLECGLTGRIKRANLGIRMDIFKWEGCVDFGFSF